MDRGRRQATPQPPQGKIATFFSFKGGVGRTMALANCAFIAAMHGRRVLVMDWDLEAPGLPYYFRGLIDQRGTGEIRKAPGVLDLFWGWQLAVDGAKSSKDLEERIARYRKHDAFKACVNPLVERRRLPEHAKLDVISAGASKIRCPELLSYAEALSRFNWADFFEESAGGSLIYELTRWCRANYDLILIDSRTGLADVAGICTMQIPDSVYLSFVFNRQNIEGSAQVARSITGARNNEIDVRVVPMRVSKDRPSEEADARARAARELKRAGLDPQRVDDDLTALAVPASSAVPYYEALTAFTSSESAAGDLNWAYKRLTQELLGVELAPLKLDPKWGDEVRARLLPSITTIEYLRELGNADPDRAIEEVSRYLDGALDADPSLEVEPDYIRALITATIDAIEGLWEVDEAVMRALEGKTLRLIEHMHALGEGDWRLDFVDALDEFGYRFVHSMEEHEERLARQARILADGSQDAGMLVRQAETAIQRARFSRDQGQPEQALERVAFADKLSEEAEAQDAPAEDLRYLRASVADIRARLALEVDMARALGQFDRLLEQVDGSSDTRVRFLGAEAHLTLASLEEDEIRRRDHMLAALTLQPRVILRDLDRLTTIVKTALDTEPQSEMALRIGKILFADQRLARAVSFGRTTETALRFLRLANQLVRALAGLPPGEAADVQFGISDAAVRVLGQWLRRKQYHIDDDPAAAGSLFATYEALIDRLQLAGLPSRQIGKMRDLLAAATSEGEDEDDDE